MIQVTGTVAFDTVATVAELPERNETARIERLRLLPGGAAGNVAMGLARLGVAPRLVAAVGRDFAGSRYEASLRDAGVDLSHVAHVDDATAHAVAASDPRGAQHVYFYPGAAYALPDEPVPEADVAHFSAGPIDRYATRMRACRRVTLDPGQELFHRNVEDVTRLVPLVDVLFVNEFELARLERAAGLGVEGILDSGPSVVVVTRGEAGQSVYPRDEDPVHLEAVPTRVVEPTGAGDAHRAGFLYAYAKGADAVTAARVGAVTASFAVSAMGTQEALPTLAEARERFEKVYGPWPLDASSA